MYCPPNKRIQRIVFEDRRIKALRVCDFRIAGKYDSE